MLFLFITLSIVLLVLVCVYSGRTKKITEEFNQFKQKKDKELSKEFEARHAARTQELDRQFAQKQQLTNEQLAQLDQLITNRQQQLTATIEASKQQLANTQQMVVQSSSSFQHQLDLQKQKILDVFNEGMNSMWDDVYMEKQLAADSLANSRKELSAIQAEIAQWQAKRDAINRDILRQRETEQQQDFYKIKLSTAAKKDIAYLISILPNLSNQDILCKLIWSEYLIKPFNTMIKNVCGDNIPRNCIYIITNTNTNEVYVGKTAGDLKTRWTDHIKTSLGIGGAKRSLLHSALYQHWDEFTFQILEKVPLDADLGAREKYYIDFYNSTTYGYNVISGG